MHVRSKGKQGSCLKWEPVEHLYLSYGNSFESVVSGRSRDDHQISYRFSPSKITTKWNFRHGPRTYLRVLVVRFCFRPATAIIQVRIILGLSASHRGEIYEIAGPIFR